ncbi:MAG: ImmA/IrrE family metallo-endopeptidase [Dermatophilaceae bacterium]
MAREYLARAHGRRLSALRAIWGLTQADLAARLDVTQSFLSHLERGSRPIPDSLRLRTSREFGLPLSFFAVHPDAAERSAVTFRKSSTASGRDEARVVALYDEAARLFRRVSDASGFHAADLPDPADHQGDPELVAEALRSAAGLASDAPVPNAIRAIERLGIGVVDNLDNLHDEARGHTAVSRPSHHNDRPLVALVSELPGAVKRLTVLHEVGHLIFDRDLAGPVGTRSREEKRAYMFASAYLLPERVVRQRVSETVNLHGYLPIKADYGISVGAIVMRSRDLGVISAQRARSLQIQLASLRWRSDEPVPVANETPRLLGQAVRHVYGTRSNAKAADDLGMASEWIDQWTRSTAKHTNPDRATIIDLSSRRRARPAG